MLETQGWKGGRDAARDGCGWINPVVAAEWSLDGCNNIFKCTSEYYGGSET